MQKYSFGMNSASKQLRGNYKTDPAQSTFYIKLIHHAQKCNIYIYFLKM